MVYALSMTKSYTFLIHTYSILATMEGTFPPVDLKYLIIVEPAVVTQEAWDENKEMCMGALALTSAVVMKRRDVWNSREDAKKYFEARPPWKGWDPRVVDLYTVGTLTRTTVLCNMRNAHSHCLLATCAY